MISSNTVSRQLLLESPRLGLSQTYSGKHTRVRNSETFQRTVALNKKILDWLYKTLITRTFFHYFSMVNVTKSILLKIPS